MSALEIRGLEVSLGGDPILHGIDLSVAPGEAVALEVSLDTGGAEAGPHVVRVTVSGPDGTERAYYSTNLTAWSNKARASVPLSPSDEPGDWTITARDIISGQQAALTLAVSAE